MGFRLFFRTYTLWTASFTLSTTADVLSTGCYGLFLTTDRVFPGHDALSKPADADLAGSLAS